MLGGFLEYNSMYFGFSSLYFLAGLLYLLAFCFILSNTKQFFYLVMTNLFRTITSMFVLRKQSIASFEFIIGSFHKRSIGKIGTLVNW